MDSLHRLWDALIARYQVVKSGDDSGKLTSRKFNVLPLGHQRLFTHWIWLNIVQPFFPRSLTWYGPDTRQTLIWGHQEFRGSCLSSENLAPGPIFTEVSKTIQLCHTFRSSIGKLTSGKTTSIKGFTDPKRHAFYRGSCFSSTGTSLHEMFFTLEREKCNFKVTFFEVQRRYIFSILFFLSKQTGKAGDGIKCSWNHCGLIMCDAHWFR